MSMLSSFDIKAHPGYFPNAKSLHTWTWPDNRYPGRLISPPVRRGQPLPFPIGETPFYRMARINLNHTAWGLPGYQSTPPLQIPGWNMPNSDICVEHEIVPLSSSAPLTRDNFLLNFVPDGGFGSEWNSWVGTTGLKFITYNAKPQPRISWPTKEFPKDPNTSYKYSTHLYVRSLTGNPLRFVIRSRWMATAWPTDGPGTTAVPRSAWYYTSPVATREYIMFSAESSIAKGYYNTLRPRTVAERTTERTSTSTPHFLLSFNWPHEGRPYKITRRDQIGGSNDSRRITLKIINTRNIPSGSKFTFKIIPISGKITSDDFSNITWSNKSALEWTATVSGTGNGTRYQRNIFAAGKVVNTVDKFQIRLSYDLGPGYTGPATITTPTYSIVKTL